MFGRWDELLAAERVMEGTLYLDGMSYYTQGSSEVGRDDLEAAEHSLSQLRAVAEDPGSRTIQRASNSVAVLMELAAFGLEGEIKAAQGNLDGAIAAFESAVAIEEIGRASCRERV